MSRRRIQIALSALLLLGPASRLRAADAASNQAPVRADWAPVVQALRLTRQTDFHGLDLADPPTLGAFLSLAQRGGATPGSPAAASPEALFQDAQKAALAQAARLSPPMEDPSTLAASAAELDELHIAGALLPSSLRAGVEANRDKSLALRQLLTVQTDWDKKAGDMPDVSGRDSAHFQPLARPQETISHEPEPPPLRFQRKPRWPWLTGLLLFTNTAAFAGQVSGFIDTIDWALIPERFWAQLHSLPGAARQIATVVTTGFLHANLGHLAGNMMGLAMFGVILEMVLSRKRIMIVLAASQLAGALLALATGMAGIGFSVMAMGLIGAFVGAAAPHIRELLRNRRPTLRQRIGTGLVIALSFIGVQSPIGDLALLGAKDNIAHPEHLAGFLAGLALALYWYRRDKRLRDGQPGGGFPF